MLIHTERSKRELSQSQLNSGRKSETKLAQSLMTGKKRREGGREVNPRRKKKGKGERYSRESMKGG